MAKFNKSFLRGKRIVITGGTGFIGSHLLASVLEYKPAKVLLVSRGSNTSKIGGYLSKIDLKIYHSSSDYVRHIVNFNPDYLFILGGNADPRVSLIDPKGDLESNLLYNFYLLDKFRSLKNTKIKIVYISSVAIYGESKKIPLEEEKSTTIPESPYGINKLAMEGYIRFFSKSFRINGLSVRLFSTYGPQLNKQVVYDFIQKLLHNPKSLTICGDGSEIRDLSYIDDQVNGLLLLAQKGKFKGEVYNLGSGVGISISNLALKIAKLMNLKPRLVYQKQNKETHHGKIWIADISKVMSLKHIPKTSFDTGLKKTIDWVKQL